MTAGERGIVSHPARSREFRENVAACVDIAARTGCTLVNAPYGLRVPGMGEDVADVLSARREKIRHVQVVDPAGSAASFGWL